MKKGKEEITIIDSEPVGEGEYGIYTLPNGNKVQIGKYDLGFFRKLQKLPPQTKIRMMCLSAEEMQKHISEEKKRANEYLIELLSKKWYWRAEGDEAEITNEMIPGVELSAIEILKKSKSKRPLSLTQINAVIHFYTKENTEVYQKEENL